MKHWPNIHGKINYRKKVKNSKKVIKKQFNLNRINQKLKPSEINSTEKIMEKKFKLHKKWQFLSKISQNKKKVNKKKMIK